MSIAELEIDLRFAKRALWQAQSEEIAECIVNATGLLWRIEPRKILEGSRKQPVSFVHHVAMYLVCELTVLSYLRTAKFFRRTHPTVIEAHNKITDVMGEFPLYRKPVSDVAKKVAESFA